MNCSNTLLKLRKHLESRTGKAIIDYNMIEDGDTVLVCVSGGKDSYTLLAMLMALQQRAPVKFRLIAMNVDQKQPGFPADILPNYFKSIGIEYRIVESDTYSIVKDKIAPGKTTCSLCSRLRRGILYRVADELGATKIALGHHRDDILETFFLNMFFGGKLKGMPAKLVSDDGKHMVIRPMAYVKEEDTERYAEVKNFPIIPCNLCGSQENLQRKHIKGMLREWEKKHPGRVENIFSSLSTVVPSHLMDRELFSFTDLQMDGVANPLGDIAFDEDPCSTPSTVPGIIPLQR